MSALRFVSLSIIAATLAAAASVAAGRKRSRTVSRAEVKAASPPGARRRRAARRAGEAMQSFAARGDQRLDRCRASDVRDETRRWRAPSASWFRPGKAGRRFVAPVGMPMARADVRDSVRQANLNGELARAGEGDGPGAIAPRART